MSANEHANVLIVDDDREIRELVSAYLSDHGLTVHCAANAQQMRQVMGEHPVQVALLDIMLPGEDGLTLCRELKDRPGLAVIMVTALAEESDRVLGLEIGADDYLTKPFSSRELLARIRAVLRRTNDALAVHRMDRVDGYAFERWQLTPHKRELHDPQGHLISLTAGEFDLLLAFVRNPGRILDRDQLLELTKGRRTGAFDRSVDVQLSRLRKRLGAADWIKTVRGGGYLFAPDVQRLGT